MGFPTTVARSAVLCGALDGRRRSRRGLPLPARRRQSPAGGRPAPGSLSAERVPADRPDGRVTMDSESGVCRLREAS